jgi:hypothetical protein
MPWIPRLLNRASGRIVHFSLKNGDITNLPRERERGGNLVAFCARTAKSFAFFCESTNRLVVASASSAHNPAPVPARARICSNACRNFDRFALSIAITSTARAEQEQEQEQEQEKRLFPYC